MNRMKKLSEEAAFLCEKKVSDNKWDSVANR